MNADILDKFLNSIKNKCAHACLHVHTQTEGFTINVISGGITTP